MIHEPNPPLSPDRIETAKARFIERLNASTEIDQPLADAIREAHANCRACHPERFEFDWPRLIGCVLIVASALALFGWCMSAVTP